MGGALASGVHGVGGPGVAPGRMTRPHPNGVTGFWLDVAAPDPLLVVDWLGGWSPAAWRWEPGRVAPVPCN